MRKWKQVIVILGLLLFVIIINILNKKDYVASENASLYKEPLIVEYESETNPPINKLNISGRNFRAATRKIKARRTR